MWATHFIFLSLSLPLLINKAISGCGWSLSLLFSWLGAWISEVIAPLGSPELLIPLSYPGRMREAVLSLSRKGDSRQLSGVLFPFTLGKPSTFRLATRVLLRKWKDSPESLFLKKASEQHPKLSSNIGPTIPSSSAWDVISSLFSGWFCSFIQQVFLRPFWAIGIT